MAKDNYQFSSTDMSDLAEWWFERLTAKVNVATESWVQPSNLRHSGIWGAGDDAVLNEVHGKSKIFPFSRLNISAVEWDLKKTNLPKKAKN